MTQHAQGNAYEALNDHSGGADWAFGTRFNDPLGGVDTTVPEGVNREDLATYCLMLGDDALITAQRLLEWAAHAPELEEELALANLSLDLQGQARLLLARAADADPACVPALPAGSPVPAEDALAFFRVESEFRCVRLAELANADFADIVVRVLLLGAFRLALLGRLADSRDPVLAAVAHKGATELRFHRDWAAGWVRVFGRGTDESRMRAARALARQWPFVDELFITSEVEARLAAAGVAVAPQGLRDEFDTTVAEVLAAAALEQPHVPAATGVAGRSGRAGLHSEDFGPMLAVMQSVARAHPMGRW